MTLLKDIGNVEKRNSIPWEDALELICGALPEEMLDLAFAELIRKGKELQSASWKKNSTEDTEEADEEVRGKRKTSQYSDDVIQLLG